MGKFNYPTITLTQSNGRKEILRINEIVKVEPKYGFGINPIYNTIIQFKNGEFHYYIETIKEINNIYVKKQQ